MKREYTIFLCFISIVFGQVSLDDLNKLGNDQLDLIKSQLKSGTIPSEALAPTKDTSLESAIPSSVTIGPATSAVADGSYFGYDYFKRDINFFYNVPTPPDFKFYSQANLGK